MGKNGSQMSTDWIETQLQSRRLSAQADMAAFYGPNPAQPACLRPYILRDPVAFPRYLTVTRVGS